MPDGVKGGRSSLISARAVPICVGDVMAWRKSPKTGAFAGAGGKGGKKLPVCGTALPLVDDG